MIVNENYTTLGDITEFINTKLGPALDGEDEGLAVTSMLTFILMVLKPDITADEVQKYVQDASAYLVTLIADSEEGQAN